LLNSRIEKFANDGTYLAQWGTSGNGDGQFKGPVRIAIGPGANIFVVDNGNSRVEAFTLGGAFIAKWGGPGTSTGQFNNPIGIAVDGAGGIYVADTNNSRIQKFGFAPTPVQGTTWGALKSRYRSAPGAQR